MRLRLPPTVSLVALLMGLSACGSAMPQTRCVEQATTLAQADACRKAVVAAQTAEAGAKDGGTNG